MQDKYLVTPTLLNAFDWYRKDSEFKSDEEQRKEFLQTLSRAKFEPTAAMQKGIDFENRVKEFCGSFVTSYHFEYDKVAEEFAGITKGGIWQVICKKDLQIGNQQFLLYGRCDVIKADTVYDIKYTGNYDLGKYQDSAQHLIYLYCLDLPKFSYLISDGKEYWKEDYFNHSKIEDEIKSKISDFISYLESDDEARGLFYSKWSSK